MAIPDSRSRWRCHLLCIRREDHRKPCKVGASLSPPVDAIFDLHLHRERTLDEHKKLVQKITKQNKKRQRSIEAAGIDYVCPEIVGEVVKAPKRIKFAED